MTATLLAACGDAPSKPVAKPKKTAAAKEAAKPELASSAAEAEQAPLYEYAYSPIGKRDPFRSVLDDEQAKPQLAAGVRDCGPLCKWDLEQFKLVAVISGMSNPLAMVEDPSGRGYVVRRGTFIGKRNGKVSQIRSGEVIVTEVFKDQMGKPHLNQIVIQLPKDEKGKKGAEDIDLLGAEVMQ
ncbi:MAG: pilus assembly protein PilP [Myxococcales bacterium]